MYVTRLCFGSSGTCMGNGGDLSVHGVDYVSNIENH